MPKITGGKQVSERLRQLASPEAKRQIGAALKRGGDILADTAQISITTGAVSGKSHVPSAPGTPPNNDLGGLANNIESSQYTTKGGSILVEVSSNARYAAAQEFGNSRLPARPYMRPAAAQSRDQITAEIAAAVSHIAKGGKVTG